MKTQAMTLAVMALAAIGIFFGTAGLVAGHRETTIEVLIGIAMVAFGASRPSLKAR